MSSHHDYIGVSTRKSKPNCKRKTFERTNDIG
jgi:hypothetical protein